jgi:hypothetical protein
MYVSLSLESEQRRASGERLQGCAKINLPILFSRHQEVYRVFRSDRILQGDELPRVLRGGGFGSDEDWLRSDDSRFTHDENENELQDDLLRRAPDDGHWPFRKHNLALDDSNCVPRHRRGLRNSR